MSFERLLPASVCCFHVDATLGGTLRSQTALSAREVSSDGEEEEEEEEEVFGAVAFSSPPSPDVFDIFSARKTQRKKLPSLYTNSPHLNCSN